MQDKQIDVMSLATQIKQAARDMIIASRDQPKSANDHQDHTAILFTGNIHHNVPHALLFSSDIGPTEKTIWQIMRALITNNHVASQAPRRTEIAAAVPCTEPTVTKSRYSLRVNRWLTFCTRVRNEGRVVGDVYLLHEEPLPLYETIMIDPNFDLFLREIVDSENRHSKKTVQLAKTSLDQIGRFENPRERTHLESVRERIGSRNDSYSKIFNVVNGEKPAQSGVNAPLRPLYSKNLSLDDRRNENLSLGRGQRKNLSHSSSSCSSSSNNHINSAREDDFPDSPPNHHSVFLAHFPQFKHSRYLDDIAVSFLGSLQVLPIVRQQINRIESATGDEILYQLIAKLWRSRAGEPAVRNITGYVAGLIKKVEHQKFHLDDYGIQVKEAVEEDDPSNLVGLLPNWKEL